jgi:hypothetical protein
MVFTKENLIVFGAPNANINDRFLSRDEVITVQYLNSEMEFKSIPYFSSIGKFGISSICWEEGNPLVIFYTTGVELYRLELRTGECKMLPISYLRDVHEIVVYDDIVWLSNTYYDELVGFSLSENKEVRRIKLNGCQNNIEEIINRQEIILEENHKSKFHTNQVFKAYDDELYALVHHVDGKQLIRRVAQKLLKNQGNGGVLNLANGKTQRLKLKAPHTVRLIKGNYWIFDSGHAQLNVYNKDWELIKEISMAGWGRGGLFYINENLFFAGFSSK